MNEFHVAGAVLAIWAVLVTFLGLRVEGFPRSQGAERLVMAISTILVVATIGAAIYSASNEDKKAEGGGEGKAAAVLPL